MMGVSLQSLAVLGLAGLAAAVAVPKTRNYAVDRSYSEMSDLGTNYKVFEHAATNSRTRFVTDSKICETTPNVKQYSGYFDVGTSYLGPLGSHPPDSALTNFKALTRTCSFGFSRPATSQRKLLLPSG